MAIKPGDKVRMIDDEPRYKAEKCSRIGQEAIVLAVGVPGYESVKLKDRNGDIFYAPLLAEKTKPGRQQTGF